MAQGQERQLFENNRTYIFLGFTINKIRYAHSRGSDILLFPTNYWSLSPKPEFVQNF